MDIEKLNNIKSEIIVELLFNYVKDLSKNYKEYFVVNDCQLIDEVTCEVSIYVDTIYKLDDFNSKNMYGIYLKDYELKCKEFIEELNKKLQLKDCVFDEIFYSEDELEGDFYYCCELYFKVYVNDGYCV